MIRSTAVAVVPTPFQVAATRDRLVPLRDLDIAPENLRFGEPPDDDIPLLAETLFAAGQLQPLTVRPGRKKEAAHMALDGRRRLLALRLLNLRQARLLARLPDPDEQAELAQMTMDGHGFQDWRVTEKLDETRVTARDARFALIGPERYAQAGGRTETDLFAELPPVLLDPAILTEVWTKRAREIASVYEVEGLTVHVTAGPEPDLPDDLESAGYVYGGMLPAALRPIPSSATTSARRSSACSSSAEPTTPANPGSSVSTASAGRRA